MKSRSNELKKLQPQVRSICLKTVKGSIEFEQFNPKDPFNFEIGHGMLVVPKYSYDQIVEHITSYVKMCAGNTIDDVIRRVGLLGEWESEWEVQLD